MMITIGSPMVIVSFVSRLPVLSGSRVLSDFKLDRRLGIAAFGGC